MGLTSPSADRDETLQLANTWLGTDMSLQRENVTTVRTQDGQQSSEYATVFADRYNDLVGLADDDALVALHDGVDPRGTGPFVLQLLKQHACRSIMDTCGGCQYDAIFFSGASARGDCKLDRIVSNELDPALFHQGEKNLGVVRARTNLKEPELTRHPWQELASHFAPSSFDATMCMGNSFAHLSDKNQRRQSLANMAAITKNLTILDMRNFDKMLAAREALRLQTRDMLQSSNFIGSSGSPLFPGSVANFPVFISDDKVVIAYVKKGERDPYAFVSFYPLPFHELVSEAEEFFGDVEAYHDRKQGSLSDADRQKLDGPSTMQLVCRKPKHDHARMVIDAS